MNDSYVCIHRHAKIKIPPQINTHCHFEGKTMHTCVLQNKSIATEGSVAAESQEESVGAALDVLGNIGAVETTQQGAERVGPIVDM